MSTQNQNLQVETVDASKTTQNIKSINKTQDQNPQAVDQKQAQSFVANYAVVSPKAENSTLQSGWQTENGNSYYYRDGQKLTGQQNINGKDYYFNDQGQQQNRINGMIKSTCRIKQHHRKNKHSQCHNMNMIAPL